MRIPRFHDNFIGYTYQNMGNCFERCCGKLDKRKYLRTRYNVERDFSIEFENLMDDDAQQEEMTSVVRDSERQYLLQGQFDVIVHEQKRIDAEIDQQLLRQEEELRMEEEAYYEAKREAARVARLQRQKEMASKAANAAANGANWLGDEENEWDVAGGEDDFEMFLESVKARSLAARTRALASQVPMDAQSTVSSAETKERSQTEASSLDLEWEHEAGMTPVPKEKCVPPDDRDLAELNVKPMLKDSPVLSNDLEWDHDLPNDQAETKKLLDKTKSSEEEEEMDR